MSVFKMADINAEHLKVPIGILSALKGMQEKVSIISVRSRKTNLSFTIWHHSAYLTLLYDSYIQENRQNYPLVIMKCTPYLLACYYRKVPKFSDAKKTQME